MRATRSQKTRSTSSRAARIRHPRLSSHLARRLFHPHRQPRQSPRAESRSSADQKSLQRNCRSRRRRRRPSSFMPSTTRACRSSTAAACSPALQKAGVPSELHEYSKGGSVSATARTIYNNNEPEGWLDRVYAWIQTRGFCALEISESPGKLSLSIRLPIKLRLRDLTCRRSVSTTRGTARRPRVRHAS